MAKKKQTDGTLTVEQLEALHNKVRERKLALFNELMAVVSQPNGLDDLESVDKLFVGAAAKEETLTRVGGVVGELMRQKAVEAKRAALKLTD